MNVKKWIEKNCASLTGKTIAITGSTGGLGNELVKQLVNLDANVIVVNRSKEKSLKQTKEILALNPTAKIETLICDLTDFEKVKETAEILKTKNLDALILNSGIYACPRFKTNLGFDNVFQTNFLSHYYLTKQLLPVLEKSNLGRVVAVGSIAHNYSKLDENDIDFSTRKKSSLVYGNSKRFLMFSLFELFKNVNNATLSVVHPGITFTNITSHYPKPIWWLIKYPMKIIFPNPKKACLNILSGLFFETKAYHWIGPKLFNVWGKPTMKKLKTCTETESEKIYEISEKIIKNIEKSEKTT